MNMTTSIQRNYRGSAVAERRAQRRQQLIDAATQVYGRNGYRHSSVRQVCEAAGLTQRYFYESFSHSDELLIACYQQAVGTIRQDNTAAVQAAGPCPEARSRAWLQAHFQALKDQPLIARLLMLEIRGISPAVDAAIAEALHTTSNDMAQLLSVPGQPAADDELLRAGILGGVIHIALHWMAGGYQIPVEEVVATAYKLGKR